MPDIRDSAINAFPSEFRSRDATRAATAKTNGKLFAGKFRGRNVK